MNDTDAIIQCIRVHALDTALAHQIHALEAGEVSWESDGELISRPAIRYAVARERTPARAVLPRHSSSVHAPQVRTDRAPSIEECATIAAGVALCMAIACAVIGVLS